MMDKKRYIGELFMKLMDLNSLKNDILGENEESLFILEEFKNDIITDDFYKGHIIPYHLIPPTKEWLKSRILWSKKITHSTKITFENLFVNAAFNIDHNMFITLNNIIILDNANESDLEELCELTDCDEDDLPYFEKNYLGLKWNCQNSVILVLQRHKDCVENLDYFCDALRELKIGLCMTLIHELRHLGLDNNPFLSPEYKIDNINDEESVEQWTIDTFERTKHLYLN